MKTFAWVFMPLLLVAVTVGLIVPRGRHRSDVARAQSVVGPDVVRVANDPPSQPAQAGAGLTMARPDDSAIQDAYRRGLQEGYLRGSQDGYHQGNQDGYQKGSEQGYSQGYQKGTFDGYAEGLRRGGEEGYRRGVLTGYAVKAP